MMPGMIMLWYGTEASIPSGWHVCDGTAGTPDLTGRFVSGGGNGNVPGTTGGANTHTHTFTGDGHTHDLASGVIVADVDPAGNFLDGTDSTPAAGTTNLGLNVPLFHVLCYIMKLSIP